MLYKASTTLFLSHRDQKRLLQGLYNAIYLSLNDKTICTRLVRHVKSLIEYYNASYKAYTTQLISPLLIKRVVPALSDTFNPS